MRITYFEKDDTLVIHVADKPIARETSQDWNTHVSFARTAASSRSSFWKHGLAAHTP